MDLDTIKSELLSVADSGLKYASSKKPDAEIEIYLTQSSSIDIDIQGGVVLARDSVYSGSAVRLYHKKKKSFACTSGISIENIKKAVDEALDIINGISFTDERFKSLYSPAKGKESPEGIIDPEITQLNSDVMGKEATKLVAECKIDDKIISISGSRSASYGSFAVVNSLGVNAASRYTVNVGEIGSVAKEGNKQKEGFKFCVTRNIKDFDLTGLGKEASEEALFLLNSKPLGKSEQMPVLWETLPAALYFRTAIIAPVSGKTVVEGDSYFADKIGDQVSTTKLNVVDDGLLPEAFTTNAIDSEGSPSQRTSLIEKGILKSFITDSYYGNLLETESTSNCKRNGNPSYEALPGISSNTLTVDSSNKKSFESLVSEIDSGILLKGFLLGIMHTNPVTGDMSAVSPSAYLIEKGEIKHAVDAINVAGNIYKSLNNITMFGSDTDLTPFGVKTPSLITDGFTVTG